MMEQSLPLLAAVLLIRFVASEALYQKARQVGEEMRFPAGVILRGTLGFGLPMGIYGVYKASANVRESGEWWLAVIFVVLVMLGVFSDPGEIRLTANGIRLLRLLGLRRKYIPWEGATASYDPGRREVLVVGPDGRSIMHSQYHVGQDQFLHELKRHGVRIS